MGVSGCSGRSDVTLFVHITLGPVYFQYTRSRLQESYKVVSLPSIQLTPNNLYPTVGHCSTSLLYFEIESEGWISLNLVAFLAGFGARGQCFELDEWENVVGVQMSEFSLLVYDRKLLCATFESPRVSGCPGISDASFVAHITISPVYFQYTRSRPQESYKVVSLPSIQLTPNYHIQLSDWTHSVK